MLSTNLEIINEIREFLLKMNEEKADYVSKKGAFSRATCLSFLRVIGLILKLPKRSMSIELVDFFEEIESIDQVCTGSAFSQARYKLKWEVFKDLFVRSSKLFYEKKKEQVRRWKGFRLRGCDGSTLNLPDTLEIRSFFGTHRNQAESFPQARIVCGYDLLNDIIIQADIKGIKVGEKQFAIEQLSEVEEDMLSIYDRNFASFELIYLHLFAGKHFIIRSKLGFNNVVKEFVASGKQSADVDFRATPTAVKNLQAQGYDVSKSTTVTIRLERVELENGISEVLITSLMDRKEFNNKDLKWAYKQRWGSETNYDGLKNKFELELFTGHKPVAILQDFFATAFVYNLNALLVRDCDEEIQEVNQRRQLNYKINKNVSIGLTKPRLIKLLFTADEEQINEILNFLKTHFLKNLQPEIPDRSYKRKKKKAGTRHKIRPLTNYKRAS